MMETQLAESVAICRYVEELHPDPPLFGTTPIEGKRSAAALSIGA